MPYIIDVDPRLLSHEEHLPETIECSCGYARNGGWILIDGGWVCPA